MTKDFKNELIGERIVLKRTYPNLETAKVIFEAIDSNRDRLKPWFPWEKLTLKVEDSLKYLFNKEEKTKNKEKLEYGIYVNNEYAGNIGIFNINKDRKSAEIGYWISSSFVRKGYMSEALRLLEKEFFENFDINRIQIKCDEENIASMGVAKKCGYIFEGKLREERYGEYFDSFRNAMVFSKLESDFKQENQ